MLTAEDGIVRLLRCGSRDEYERLLNTPTLTIRWMLENHLSRANAGRSAATISGFCAPCGRTVDFRASFDGGWRDADGLLIPNWRDFLRCPACEMNGRQRMITQLITGWALDLPRRDAAAAYMMEEVTPLYAWATRAFPSIRWIGSEYLGPQYRGGRTRRGVRHENAEALSFADASFDLVVSCDVLEHVNDPPAVLAEIRRVLRARGTAVLTFPMDPTLDRNRRRAALTSTGEIRHELPPTYHQNPLSRDGSLVFTDFGWEVLEQLRVAGLDAALYYYWAYELGYLGIQFYVVASKADDAENARSS